MTNGLLHLVVRSNNEILHDFFVSKKDEELKEEEIETCLKLMKENYEAYGKLGQLPMNDIIMGNEYTSNRSVENSFKLDKDRVKSPSVSEVGRMNFNENTFMQNTPKVFVPKDNIFVAESKANNESILSCNETVVFNTGSSTTSKSAFRSSLARLGKSRMQRPAGNLIGLTKYSSPKPAKSLPPALPVVQEEKKEVKVTKAAQIILEALGNSAPVNAPKVPSVLTKRVRINEEKPNKMEISQEVKMNTADLPKEKEVFIVHEAPKDVDMKIATPKKNAVNLFDFDTPIVRQKKPISCELKDATLIQMQIEENLPKYVFVDDLVPGPEDFSSSQLPSFVFIDK